MLRVLTLSTLFPNGAEPNLGVFVERQTLALAARPDVAVEVVAPVGLPVWPLSRHRHYAARALLPLEEERNGLRVHRPRFTVWPRVGESRTPAAMARALLPLLRRIRARFAFDVIDAEFFWPDGPAAMILARALGIPFSVKARGSDIHHWGAGPATAGQVLAAGRAADGLLAVCAAMKGAMVDLGMPADKIAVHHTGVDADRFRPVDRPAAKRALGIAGPLLVAPGALIPRKGHRHALDALAFLPEAALLIAGDGPERDSLVSRARALGVSERVRFLGAVAHAEMPALLAAADVAVLPTTAEGLANVWVEALACGTPVVTADVGGAREVIDCADAGRLVPRDGAAIAAAVRAILDDPPDPLRVRRCAERFSWERNAAELHAHLGGLCEHGRGGAATRAA